MVADISGRRLVVGSSALALLLLAMAGCTSNARIDAALPPAAEATLDEPVNRPLSRAGDLGQEDLPGPADLGRGWDYRVDQGSAEEGYVGSGQPATVREPESVLAAITPLGCRPGQLPRPESALEVTYAKGKLPGVALVLRFGDDQTASQFFADHTQVLKRCVGSRGVDLTVEQASNRLVVTTRTEQLGQTPVWTEGVSLRGDEVMLIAVAVADSSRAGVRSVVSALT
jgi:hypothetical protein